MELFSVMSQTIISDESHCNHSNFTDNSPCLVLKRPSLKLMGDTFFPSRLLSRVEDHLLAMSGKMFENENWFAIWTWCYLILIYK